MIVFGCEIHQSNSSTISSRFVFGEGSRSKVWITDNSFDWLCKIYKEDQMRNRQRETHTHTSRHPVCYGSVFFFLSSKEEAKENEE